MDDIGFLLLIELNNF